jgi:hypothetical protein
MTFVAGMCVLLVLGSAISPLRALGMIVVAGIVLLGVTSLIALVALCRYPRLWLRSLGVLATAAGIVFYLPIRVAFLARSSLDPFDAIEFFAEILGVVTFLGLLHLALFGVLMRSVVESRKRAESLKTKSLQGRV